MVKVCRGMYRRGSPNMASVSKVRRKKVREGSVVLCFFQLHILSLSVTHLSKTFPMLESTQRVTKLTLSDVVNTHWYTRKQIYEFSENFNGQAEWNLLFSI